MAPDISGLSAFVAIDHGTQTVRTPLGAVDYEEALANAPADRCGKADYR